MKYWVGLVLMAWMSSAVASDNRVVAKAWATTDASLARAHLNRAECAQPNQRLACAMALNRAATLLSPVEHLELNNGAWRLVTGDATTGTTFFTIYQTKMAYSKLLARWSTEVASFDFDALMREILRRKSASTPNAMVWGVALAGYLNAFDAHASITPSALLESSSDHGERTGLGFNLDYLSNGIFVHHVDERSPAMLAGLRDDDQLLGLRRDDLEFFNVEGRTPSEITQALAGPAGTRYELRVRRGGQELSINIVVAPYDIHFVQAQILSPGVGLIKINTFKNTAVCGQVSEALEILKQKEVHRLILDLRGNPGGDSGITICVAGLFVGPQVIYTDEAVASSLPAWARDLESVRLSPGRHTYASTNAQVWTELLVVLVDGLSASGSEILAQAIRQYRADSWLVGETTMGKGSEQMRNNQILHGQGLTFGYTVAKLILAGDYQNQLVGVTPDFIVPLRYGASDQDRYYPPEADRYANARPAEPAPPWKNPRPFETSVLQACVEARGHLAEERARLVDLIGRADHQIAFAGAVLRCLE